MKPLKFYDVKNRKSIMTSNYIITKRKNRKTGRTVTIAVANYKGRKLYRIMKG